MKKMIVFTAAGCLAAALCTFPAEAAQDSRDQQIQDLQRQVSQMQKKIDSLENQQQSGMSSLNSGGSWDPYSELERMQDEMQRMLRQIPQDQQKMGMFSSNIGFNNKLNVQETPTAYTITFDMHGMDQDNVDVEVNPTSLTVKGVYSNQESKQDPNAYFQTQQFGSFAQTIPIPEDADSSRIKTEKKNEQMIITLPKRQKLPGSQDNKNQQS